MAQPLGSGVLAAFAHPGAALACAEIAAALEETARSLACDVEETELLAVQLPPTPGITDAVARLKRRAELVGIAYAYFKEMTERPETPCDIDDFAVRPLPANAVTKP